MRRHAAIPRTPQPRGEAGFTLIELLVSVVLMLLVTGAIFSIVDPSTSTSRAQPEATDLQQRMRIGTDQISKDLLMAGAGTYSGPTNGSLANFFAPILPFRMGTLYPTEYATRFFDDRITIAYVPNTAAQTKVKEKMPQPSAEVKAGPQPNCPVNDVLCGFRDGMRALVYDRSGSFDFFTVTQVQADSTGTPHIQHAPPINPNQFSKAYDSDADISIVETHTYFRDPNTNQLMHYVGDATPPEPVIDNVVGLRFQYFGDPLPPREPRPPTGTANCIYDAGGNLTMGSLAGTGSSLVELPEDLIKQGPLCGSAPNQFDADLYRVRKVRVTLRIQAPDMLRGTDAFLFQNPGISTSAYRMIPDYEMTFEISPRNMNLTR